MRLLVLYEELAPYFTVCVSNFAEKYNVEVHIIHKKINQEAPFILKLNNLKTYDRSIYSDEELISLSKKINPDAIFCCGWSFKTYLRISSLFKGKIPEILGFDNKWNGSVKQQIARIIYPFYISNKFDFCFVPGIEQKLYAEKIGFKENQIALGAYSCDFDLFYKQYLANKAEKLKQFPKRFIFVGRYYEFKGIKDLWQAFIELQKEEPNEWELWCLGTGDIEPVKYEKIKHFGFVQPKDLPKYIRETGVFVLPSHFEPWGVVVHEFASAGFPIICSDEVGARLSFVEQNINGFIYKAGDVNQLKVQLKKMMSLGDDKLVAMGQKSVEKAKEITPEIWADTLMKLLKCYMRF